MKLGSGKLGFLALTVLLKVYETLYDTPFMKPPNPSLVPTITPNSKRTKQTAIKYKFTLETYL